MKQLKKQFRDFWEKHFRKFSSRKILVAVSGGVDSMVLLQLLHQNDFKFGVAHVNYGLRGEESNADEALVQAICNQFGIPFYTIRFDTRKLAEAQKTGIQETARNLRYDWFESLMKEEGYEVLATAHHADDSAETLLLNLFRGTGLRGLHGILPVRENLIRPLVFASKEAIRQYAAETGIAFREDASNATSDYVRNAIRNELLPLIEIRFPQVRKTLAENATRLAAAERLYAPVLARLRRKLLEPRGPDYYLPVRLWEKQPEVDTLLFELLSPFGFGAAMIPEIQKLFRAQAGRYLDSATHRLLRHRDFLVLTPGPENAEETAFVLVEAGMSEVSFNTGILNLSEASVPEDWKALPVTEIWVNADQLEWPLVLRKARPGDYFYPFGMGRKKKKVARYLTDQKCTPMEKQKVWVLTSGQKVVWVIGHRMDERFALKRDQKQGLHLRWIPAASSFLLT